MATKSITIGLGICNEDAYAEATLHFEHENRYPYQLNPAAAYVKIERITLDANGADLLPALSPAAVRRMEAELLAEIEAREVLA